MSIQNLEVLELRRGNLYYVDHCGKIVLPPAIHPIANLLQLSPEAVLAAYRDNQARDFMALFNELELGGTGLSDQIPVLRQALAAYPDNPLRSTVSLQHMRALFMELHRHVMAHPVWLHPFFRRFFEGGFSRTQLERFAQHYLNQVKNTRQCVALAIGRFHSLAALPFGPLNEVVSELVQVILAGLVADEYGVSAEHATTDETVEVGELFGATTHIVLYRQLFEALELSFKEQDVPLLPGIADNMLTQRALAGSDRFTSLEALASVGLGMEWGVPAFFSLLLGGMIRHAHHQQVELTPRAVEVFTAHVRQDVAHAISVMLATAMLTREVEDVERIKNATNLLMSSRYQMMSDIYADVFGEACPSIHQIDLAPCYRVADRRIAEALMDARRQANPAAVVEGDAWAASDRLPFVFID